MSISVATWNTQWATLSSERGPRISSTLAAIDADVIVVTEGVRELLPANGSVIDAGGNWGYGPQPARRKVIVWSRFSLTLDFVGVEGATHGRLAVATACTPAGPVRIVGVCISWRDAHVSTGRGDATPWSEHMDYLDRLAGMLAELDDDIPTVIAGDYNQRIPRGRQPIRVADRLSDVLAARTIHTAGTLPNGPHIDHIATNRRLALETVHDWPASDHLGRLSDHAGVVCRFSFPEPSTRGTGKGAAADLVAVGPKCGQAQAPADTAAPGRVPPSGGDSSSDVGLTAEWRGEIENVLRRSGDGLSHGATFQLWEQGLGDAEIAARRDVSVGATRVYLRSLGALLKGTIPTSKSAVDRDAYVSAGLPWFDYYDADAQDLTASSILAKVQSVGKKLGTEEHPFVPVDPKTVVKLGDVSSDTVTDGKW